MEDIYKWQYVLQLESPFIMEIGEFQSTIRQMIDQYSGSLKISQEEIIPIGKRWKYIIIFSVIDEDKSVVTRLTRSLRDFTPKPRKLTKAEKVDSASYNAIISNIEREATEKIYVDIYIYDNELTPIKQNEIHLQIEESIDSSLKIVDHESKKEGVILMIEFSKKEESYRLIEMIMDGEFISLKIYGATISNNNQNLKNSFNNFVKKATREDLKRIVSNLLAIDNIRLSITIFKKISNLSRDTQNNLINLSGRLTNIEQDHYNQTERSEDIRIERNKIRLNLLKMLDEIN